MDELAMLRRNTAYATAFAAHQAQSSAVTNEEALAAQIAAQTRLPSRLTAAIMHDLDNNAFILMMPDKEAKLPSENVASRQEGRTVLQGAP